MRHARLRDRRPRRVNRDTEERRTAQLAITQRVKAARHHEIKAGIDVEDNLEEHRAPLLGRRRDHELRRLDEVLHPALGPARRQAQRRIRVRQTCRRRTRTRRARRRARVVQVRVTSAAPSARRARRSAARRSTGPRTCATRGSHAEPDAQRRPSLRGAAPALRRVPAQHDRSADRRAPRHERDGADRQRRAAHRRDLRPDEEGRSKVYAHWGRFYESIPMDINDRSFGGEVSDIRQIFNAGAVRRESIRASAVPTAAAASTTTQRRRREQLIGASGVLVAPGIKAAVHGRDHRRRRVAMIPTTSDRRRRTSTAASAA